MHPAPTPERRYYAHTAEDEQGNRLPESSGKWQLLADHLRNVADLAAKFAAPFNASAEARLAGLLHDLGKYRFEFQAYLRGERSSSAETQHAVFGAAWAADENHPQLFASKLAIAGHHAGLHDHSDLAGMFAKRGLDIPRCLPALISKLEGELGPLPPAPVPPSWVCDEFSAEFYARIVFSCLVDADRLDTGHWPEKPAEDVVLDCDALLSTVHAERARKTSSNPDSPLAGLRNRIFDTALERATLPPGFFSLTVPTGGGKTLASMAFALAHARAHGLRRVIVVIPYLSIIEQNAAEYRRIFGDGVVLENHSGVQPRDDASEEERSRLDLVSENWDAPVIVTTSVQFLESLFASSPTRCRKLHRIPRSVVIFDEVQTLPAHVLAPTFNVLRQLATNYATSFIFSSATQPAFRRCTSLPDGFLPDELREIAPEPDELFRKLRRVSYHLPAAGVSLDWTALAQQLAAKPQVLCVVNLTRHAKEVWEQLTARLPRDEAPIHLSSAMCAEHRLSLLAQIRASLRDGRPCRVVSTQLIEAGVDVDFPEVWRALGPLDSIVQVAGRCNREGRRASGAVHVFRPAEHKLPRGVYSAAADQAALTLASLGDAATAGEQLATGSSVFAGYFQSLYDVVNTDYARPGESTIQDDRKLLRYREVSRKARVIEDSGTPVIVAGDNHGGSWAAPLIEEIRTRQLSPGKPRFTRDDLRRLQRYMVNVRAHKFQLLETRGLIRPLLPNLELHVLDVACYHPALGLMLENTQPDDFLV
ncbi:CRISPR-associated helicase Cas3' [Congregicoccus parvus]|uniref:CRISPR-associated helicase Cas3' n=1 Tax=Congregicoccus parvus TaxID=3081749 RepID=UPI003FA5F4C6